MSTVVFESEIKSLPLIQQGKVRDIYALGDDHLLIVTTDRLSAFDVVLPDPVPGKGAILTALSNFWFDYFSSVVRNHLSSITLEEALPDRAEREAVADRTIIVRKLKPLPIEAVARGYLIGSGWKDYLATGAVCGIALEPGLKQAEQLSQAIFTPATKAAVGDHDENIDFARTVDLIGRERADHVRELTLTIYSQAASYALERGIIIADTKLEFGLDENEELVLIDEVLTSDSSRFWPVDDYQVGTSPPSFDKQIVRDYLESLDWDKRPPGPHLPATVLHETAAKYREAQQRLSAP